MGVDHLFPALDAVCLALREHDPSVRFIDLLDEDIDLISDLDLGTFKVASGNLTLGLVAHIHDDPVIADAHHLTDNDLVFFKIAN